jgi:hypothetical protein
MPEPKPDGAILDAGRLSRGAQDFELRPDAPERAPPGRRSLGIDAVRKLRFAGTLEPEGAGTGGWSRNSGRRWCSPVS